MGESWGYESEGYVLPSGNCSLVDFTLEHRIPKQKNLIDRRKIYVAIKPKGSDCDNDIMSLLQIARATACPCFLIEGNPWPGEYEVLGFPCAGRKPKSYRDLLFHYYIGDDEFCGCAGGYREASSGHYGGILYGNKEDGLSIVWPLLNHDKTDMTSYPFTCTGYGLDNNTQFAFEAARSARFEHGESGAT